ncbi:hypothetical protein cand_024240 [Cryptosporidium andersoni]|uniref:Uncharacterized protein n=1 Tax=Cryptosporidium andersoni TaxID=117008 RepID=A0A1J4MRH0_9CRYT|nr:hypothetical protein cand_024240 [Cryptosporidium andersoni]
MTNYISRTENLGSMNLESCDISTESKYLTTARRNRLSLSSSRYGNNLRRSSVYKWSGIFSDFNIENIPSDAWEYYINIEQGEAENTHYDDNDQVKLLNNCFTLEQSIRLYKKILHSFFFGNDYLNDTQFWNDLVKRFNNNPFELDSDEGRENILKTFLSIICSSIINGDAKGYYCAMIYCLMVSLPNKPQVFGILRPFIIRKILSLINKKYITYSTCNNNTSKKSNTRKKKFNRNIGENIESENSLNNAIASDSEKENDILSLGNSSSCSNEVISNNVYVKMQIELMACLVILCQNIDFACNISSKIGMEGLQELLEGLLQILLYTYDISYFKNEVDQLKSCYLLQSNIPNNRDHIQNAIDEIGDVWNFSKASSIVLLCFFLNLGKSRFITHVQDGNIFKKFRTVEFDSIQIEIIKYYVILLLRSSIPIIIGNVTSNSSIVTVRSKSIQNSTLITVFNIIKNIIQLYPELIFPNVMYIIDQIVILQENLTIYSFSGTNFEDDELTLNYENLENHNGNLTNLEPNYRKSGRDIKEIKRFTNGIELLRELRRLMAQYEIEGPFDIEDEICECIMNNKNKLFYYDPIVAFIISLYLLMSERSETRQSILDIIYMKFIPSIVDLCETQNSSKMLLFHIIQTCFGLNEGQNSTESIKEINSFISFLSSYKPQKRDKKNKNNLLSFLTPFKYPALLHRRLITILPYFYQSARPSYRTMALEITSYVLQIRSSLEILAIFICNLNSKKNITISSSTSITNNIEKKYIELSDFLQNNIMDAVFMDCNESSPSVVMQNSKIESQRSINSSPISNNYSSNRNSSARQSIEWIGITIDSKISNSNMYSIQGEMALKLFYLILLCVQRSEDISPNIRIKSAIILSNIINSLYDLYNTYIKANDEEILYLKNEIISGIKILIFSCNNTHSNAVIPVVEMIREFSNDEKAICRKGSLLLWDSYFPFIYLDKKADINSEKDLIINIFKSALSDSSILVRRHGLQSLYTLYHAFPLNKWICNLWSIHGLPFILDTENIIIDKITEISYNILTEQISKISELIQSLWLKISHNGRNKFSNFISNINKEYEFAWNSLFLQNENQLSVIRLYKLCIRSVFKKYPLVINSSLQFLNMIIDLFIEILGFDGDDSPVDFPDLPFILLEEVYSYFHQNKRCINSKEVLPYKIISKIYYLLTNGILPLSSDMQIRTMKLISMHSLLNISNSIVETFKLMMCSLYIFINDATEETSCTPLMDAYFNIIFMEPEFYTHITKFIIESININDDNHEFRSYMDTNSLVLSICLHSILCILYIWEEINIIYRNKHHITKFMNAKNLKKKYKNPSKNTLHLLGFTYNAKVKKEIESNYSLSCPDLDTSNTIEIIYISCLMKLIEQNDEIKNLDYSTFGNENLYNYVNIRILGELSLLGYQLTNRNINGLLISSLLPILQPFNLERIFILIESLYKKYQSVRILDKTKSNEKKIISNVNLVILTMGQICYSSNNSLTKNTIQNYFIPLLVDKTAPIEIRNNVLVILHDMYILYTSLVDPHLICIFNILHEGLEKRSETQIDQNALLRKQSLLLLSDLISQGYIKLRGSYMLKFLCPLIDPLNSIRMIGRGLFEKVLLRLNPSLIVQNFVETMCFINGWLTHPCIKSWDIGHNKSLGNKYYDSEILNFNCDEKEYIYDFFINNLSDKQKFEVLCRIVHDFLALFVDQSNIIKLPESYQHNDGKTLKDALRLISSSSLCIYHKYSRKVGKISGKFDLYERLDDEGEDTNLGDSSGNCNIILKELIQASLAIDIIPTLLSLKHLMKQSCSLFIKDIHKCIGELLKDYRNNLASIIQDNTLIKELEYDFKMGIFN